LGTARHRLVQFQDGLYEKLQTSSAQLLTQYLDVVDTTFTSIYVSGQYAVLILLYDSTEEFCVGAESILSNLKPIGARLTDKLLEELAYLQSAMTHNYTD